MRTQENSSLQNREPNLVQFFALLSDLPCCCVQVVLSLWFFALLFHFFAFLALGPPASRAMINSISMAAPPFEHAVLLCTAWLLNQKLHSYCWQWAG